MIRNYDDFIGQLLDAGFSAASGGNEEGVVGLIGFSWDRQPIGSPVRWHTGDADTDPWEWRMRVLEERDDISYAKVFFRKGGFITEEWYAYFLAARRGSYTFEGAYMDGKASHFAKRIYTAVAENGRVPLHDIKRIAGFSQKDKSRFDSALTELQMQMYLTICGRRRKISKNGDSNSWASTVLCTTECFWGEGVFEAAAGISPKEAILRIKEQVFRLNPSAEENRVDRFILGLKK